MRPTRYDLAVETGDTVDLAFRLWTGTGSARVPYLPAAGETFALALRWTSGVITAATGDTDAGKLVLDTSGGATTLRRRLTAAETTRIPVGRLTSLTLTRIPAQGERRTWLTGLVTGQRTPTPGPGDTALDLTIDDGNVIVEVTVDDAAQGNTLAAAGERSFVNALLFG